jgi:hypothetical protein
MQMTRVLLCTIPIWTLLISAAMPADIAKLPEPYQSLVELARGAPPEFTADALLRIIEQGGRQGRLADKDARRDLIEEAFRSASAAKFPVRMQGLAGTTTDTASGSLSRAYSLKLDALSLESRAVSDMLQLDSAAARKLFGDIARPTLPQLTCDDALVYDLSDFYQTLNGVVNGTFTPKERAKDEHFNFLTDYLGQASSPLEVPPLALVVQSVGATVAQRQGLWARLGGLLENMQTDDRSFSSSLPLLDSLSVAEMQASLAKYRQKSRGCESDSSSAPLNASKNAGQTTPKPAAPKPATPKLSAYWQSANSQQLLQLGKKLRFDSNNLPLSEADRSTPEWQQQADDYLNQLADWTADQEPSEADYYHEKCTVLMSLIELVPPGPEDDKIISDYVGFISNSNLYQQSPAEWFLEPRALLDRFQTSKAMRAKILETFQGSGNPVLGLEVALEKTLRR